jgi:hypothetical protein
VKVLWLTTINEGPLTLTPLLIPRLLPIHLHHLLLLFRVPLLHDLLAEAVIHHLKIAKKRNLRSISQTGRQEGEGTYLLAIGIVIE